jgi:hypothetical protein
MTRCWECGRTIPLAVHVRWRYAQTGDGYQYGLAGGRNEQYGKVAYCPTCDDARTAAQQALRVRDAKELAVGAGVLAVTVVGCAVGVPWALGILLACAVAYLRMVWPVLLAGLSVATGFHMVLGRDPADDPAHALPMLVVAVAVMLSAKAVIASLRVRDQRVPREERAA